MKSDNLVSQHSAARLQMSRWLSQYGTAVLLAVIILVGALLRLNGLDTQSLWNDELAGWSYTQVDSLGYMLAEEIPSDHPPGYQVFLYFWVHHVGDSEMLLRLPFAVAGIFTIFAMFLLGRKLYSSETGLIAAALTAVLWTPLYYSQEARANIMVLLFVVLSTYWLLDIGQALKQEKKLPLTAVAGYVISAALASYLHYFGLFFVLLQTCVMGLVFLLKPKAWLKLLLMYGLVLIAYLPWLFQAANALLSGGPGWLGPPEPYQIIVFYEFLFNESAWLTQIVFLLWGFLFIKGIWAIWRRPEQMRKLLFSADGLLVAWLIVPVAIVYVKSLASTPAFLYRSLIIVLPAAYLLLARAITLLPYRRVTMPVTAVILIGLFSWQLFWTEAYFSKPTKEQFREAVAFVNQHEDIYPDSFIVSYAWDPIYLDYYFERQGATQRVDMNAGKAEDISRTQSEIANDPADHIWYIAAHRRPDAEFIEFLESEYHVVKQESFIKVDVWLFVKE